MKVTIDKSIPALTPEEVEDMKNNAKSAEDNPAEFQQQMLGIEHVVMSEEVAEQLKKIGLTPDDVIAAMLKKAKASH